MNAEQRWERDREKLIQKADDVLRELSTWCIEQDLVEGELVVLADRILVGVYASCYAKGMLVVDDMNQLCSHLPERIKRASKDFHREA